MFSVRDLYYLLDKHIEQDIYIYILLRSLNTFVPVIVHQKLISEFARLL